MDYRKLKWQSDWMYSEIFGETDRDKQIGLFSLTDFPSINLYFDYESGIIIDVWLD